MKNQIGIQPDLNASVPDGWQRTADFPEKDFPIGCEHCGGECEADPHVPIVTCPHRQQEEAIPGWIGLLVILLFIGACVGLVLLAGCTKQQPAPQPAPEPKSATAAGSNALALAQIDARLTEIKPCVMRSLSVPRWQFRGQSSRQDVPSPGGEASSLDGMQQS
jgi:hypothetical protein